ncbi:hypothetical protein CsatB_015793 [Cannabis sativa]
MRPNSFQPSLHLFLLWLWAWSSKLISYHFSIILLLLFCLDIYLSMHVLLFNIWVDLFFNGEWKRNGV